jgi:hypothetical protein
MSRIAALVLSSVLLSAVLPIRAQAQTIERVEIVLFTDDDDKDDPDEVTVQVIHRGDNKIVGEWKGGKGKTWRDKTEQNDVKFSLKEKIEYGKKNEYQLHISLNSPDNNGWHMHVRRVIGLTATGDKHVYRNKDTEGQLFGKHKGSEEPYQHDFDMAE